MAIPSVSVRTPFIVYDSGKLEVVTLTEDTPRPEITSYFVYSLHDNMVKEYAREDGRYKEYVYEGEGFTAFGLPLPLKERWKYRESNKSVEIVPRNEQHAVGQTTKSLNVTSMLSHVELARLSMASFVDAIKIRIRDSPEAVAALDNLVPASLGGDTTDPGTMARLEHLYQYRFTSDLDKIEAINPDILKRVASTESVGRAMFDIFRDRWDGKEGTLNVVNQNLGEGRDGKRFEITSAVAFFNWASVMRSTTLFALHSAGHIQNLALDDQPLKTISYKVLSDEDESESETNSDEE